MKINDLVEDVEEAEVVEEETEEEADEDEQLWEAINLLEECRVMFDYLSDLGVTRPIGPATHRNIIALSEEIDSLLTNTDASEEEEK